MKTTKRFIAIAMTLLMAAGCLAFTPAAGFAADADDPPVIASEDSGGSSGIEPFAAGPVCMIVETGAQYYDLADALAAVKDYQTIKLLTDIVYNRGIVAENISFDFDLNGKSLDVINKSKGTGSDPDPKEVSGLYVNGGQVFCTDYGNGEFNVTGTKYGVYAKVTGYLGQTAVSNATAAGGTSPGAGVFATGSDASIGVVNNVNAYRGGETYSGIGAQAEEGAHLNIGGNVFAENSTGVYAYNRSTIEIGGDITAPGGADIAGVDTQGGGKIMVGGAIKAPNGAYIKLGGYPFIQSDGVLSAERTGYLEYTDMPGESWKDDANTVYVTDPANIDAVCEIQGQGRYTSLYEATQQACEGSVIRMLKSFTYSGQLTIQWGMYFDLNGYSVNVVNTRGPALEVYYSELKLIDPENGELNVTGAQYGVSAQYGGRATVTNATTTGEGSLNAGAHADGSGSKVTVLRNVYASRGGSGTNNVFGALAEYSGTVDVKGNVYAENSTGAYADNGKITVGGTINVSSGSAYINVGGTIKTRAPLPAANAQGYYAYTNGPSSVWVKNPGFKPVCEIVGDYQYGSLSDALTTVNNMSSGSTATIRLLQNINYKDMVDISGRTLIFDLNGKILNVSNSAAESCGLYVENGRLSLLDPYNGEFNVTGSKFGVNAEQGGKVMVTKAIATGAGGSGVLANGENSEVRVLGDVNNTGNGIGAQAQYGAAVYVGGNVFAANQTGVFANEGIVKVVGDVAAPGAGKTGADARGNSGGTIPGIITVGGGVRAGGTGAYADNGSQITVEGALSTAGTYISVGGALKTQVSYDITFGGLPTSAKPNFRQYSAGSPLSYVWVKDPSAKHVCAIGTELYYSLPAAIGAVPAGGSGTIKILRDFTYEYGGDPLSIDNKNIKLDLNGKKVEVVNDYGTGLDVRNNGSIKLVDPYDGEFNVTGAIDGVFTFNSGIVELSCVKSTGTGIGVSANGSGCEIIVYGDVWNTGAPYYPEDECYGVFSIGGNRVTVEGKIIVSFNVDWYVFTGGTGKTAAQSDASSSKPGYLQYSGGSPLNTVWVKDPDICCQITETGNMYRSIVDALSAISSGGEGTIRMLKDFTYTYSSSTGLDINNKNVTFDLNGKTVEIINTNVSGYGLNVTGANGRLLLADPNNGEFNVTGGLRGLAVSAGGIAEITNAKARAMQPNAGTGVYVIGTGSGATVFGDVSASNPTQTTMPFNGAWVATGGTITVDGSIYTSPDQAYIVLENTATLQTQYNESTRQGYYEYNNGTSIVWVRDPNAALPVPVCSIGATLYYDFGDALAAVITLPGGGSATIKLLKDIDYTSIDYINIINKKVTLDLDGYRLNIVIAGDYGLYLYNNASFTLLDPDNGEFNITGRLYCVYAGQGSKAEITNVAGTGRGVYATGEGSEVTVYGDVKTTDYIGSGSIDTCGVYTSSGGKVTVDGSITVPSGADYIYLGESRGPEEYEKNIYDSPITTKPGYFMYTSDLSGPTSSTARTVWVRDPVAFAPVRNISGVPAEFTAGEPVTLAGNVLPAFANNKSILWSLTNAGTTGATLAGNVLSAKESGTLAVRAMIADGLGVNKAYVQNFTIQVNDSPVSMISVSPTHAILADTTTGAVFTAELAPGIGGTENHAKIEWNAAGPDGKPSTDVRISLSSGGKRATVYAVGTLSEKTIQISATYDRKYIATATVEILPDIELLEPGTDQLKAGTSINLLETNLTVNKVKDVGALLPILISQQGADAFGFAAFGVSAYSQSSAGSLVIERVSLHKYNSALRDYEEEEMPGYSARMCPTDDRYIEICAESSAKKTNNVLVVLWPKGSAGFGARAGAVNLSVAETYPKITLKAENLNLAFPGNAASITASSPEGECTVRSVKAPAGTIRLVDGELRLSGMAKTGTVKTTVEVDVAGYKKAYAKTPALSVKVINTLPKVKLDKASLKFLAAEEGGGAAVIRLITGDKRVPFESGYKVASVTVSNTDANGKLITKGKSEVRVTYAGGVINIQPKSGCEKGKALLKVTFTGSEKAVYLPVTIGMVKKSALKPSSKVKAFTVSTGHDTGAVVAEIPITYGVDNHVTYEWKVVNVGGVPFDSSSVGMAKKQTSGRNSVTLTVKNSTELRKLVNDNGSNKKYVLNIGSDALDTLTGKNQTFVVTLTVTAKTAGMTLSTKGKIDVANPASAINATVKLSNTTSDISSVKLLKGSDVSSDLRAVVTGTGTFNIVAAHKQVVPGVEQVITVRVTLKNGVTLPDKTVKIKPAQTVGKAAQSRKTVTLYKMAPRTGETVGLKLTTPANVKLGAVRLNQASLDGMKLVSGSSIVGAKADPTDKTDGFRLGQSGDGNWTIYFKDSVAPKAIDKKGNVAALGKSYSLRFELWAEGTYKLDSYGKPVALTSGVDKNGKPVARTKPTLVTVKVIMK